LVTVELQDVTPPDTVKPAFNEVNESRQDKERTINKAQEQANREIPKAGEWLRSVSARPRDTPLSASTGPKERLPVLRPF
jgi:regulator of protease activity HflC (stomatin/prohibitin superfamily)